MTKQTFTTVVEAVGDEPSIVISTASIDRDDDEIVPEGVVLDSYRKNPVVLFGHDRRELPVGASTSVEVERGRGLRARWRWLENDARAARVRNAFDQGILRAASVGFRALAWKPRESGRGVRFSQWELLEWSLVPVPANQDSVRTLKSLGLSWDEGDDAADDQVVLEILDDGDDVIELIDDAEMIEVDDALFRAARAASARARRLNPAFSAGLIEPATFDLDPGDFSRALREVLPDVLRHATHEMTARELRLRRGRVD